MLKYVAQVLRLLLVLVAAGALVVGVNFVVWAENPLGPLPTATAALTSTEQVTVTTKPWLTFTPRGQPPTVGLIFYPGGRVDPRSYAPAAQAIAAQGFLTVIVPMPLNLAVLTPDRALDVQQAHPEITSWVIGGHSLGGAMAASFARDYPARVQGLVFWAAYPSDDADLSQVNMPVLVLVGSNDSVVDRVNLAEARARLPAATQWVAIAGGNHCSVWLVWRAARRQRRDDQPRGAAAAHGRGDAWPAAAGCGEVGARMHDCGHYYFGKHIFGVCRCSFVGYDHRMCSSALPQAKCFAT